MLSYVRQTNVSPRIKENTAVILFSVLYSRLPSQKVQIGEFPIFFRQRQ